MSQDDLWTGVTHLADERGDRFWEGDVPTDDAPAWCGPVATLLRSAQGPATGDELAGEAEILARMQAAILEIDEVGQDNQLAAAVVGSGGAGDPARNGHPPRHLQVVPGGRSSARRRQGARLIRRVVAVKAAAVTTVVVVGVTAAAATTGIVATVVVPALSDRPPDHETSARPTAEDRSPAGDAGSEDDGSSGDDLVKRVLAEPLVCVLDPDCLLADMKEEQAKAAAGAAPAPTTPATDPAETAVADADDAATAEPPADAGTVTEERPPAPASAPPEPPPEPAPEPTTTTTEPPPTTTTTEPPPTTTTTTTAPPAEPAPEEAGADKTAAPPVVLVEPLTGHPADAPTMASGDG